MLQRQIRAEHGSRYRPMMRTIGPWLTGFIVLVALWPAVCMSGKDEPTSCQSVVLLPLPWGESADTWGMVAAVGAAVLAFFAVRILTRHAGRPGD
jgi:hypothetical protein